MSMTQFPSNHASDRAIRRQAWGEMFGMLIKSARRKSGRSVEQAARIAEMAPADWEAMEAGQVPHLNKFGCLADAIDAPVSWVASIVFFCGDAWDA